ncbi:MAG: hypothetical protein IPJ82_13650 [Lewinellaceae bacterium]|nr:hypothetical protein [Lewinellaceae bacterium]
MTFQVVFNLYPFNESLYLPSANIIRADADGQLTHFVQRATTDTIIPYGIGLTPQDRTTVAYRRPAFAQSPGNKV